MKLAKVTGSIMATQKESSLEGIRLLLIQPVDEQGLPYGEPLVACDTVQAGPGDTVFYEAGREAALALPNWFNTSDATIMGIVDSVEGPGVEAETRREGRR